MSNSKSSRAAKAQPAANPNRQDVDLRAQAEAAVHAELARLRKLDLAMLRGEWRQKWREEPPPIRSADVVFRMIAWRIQCEAFGGLAPETKRLLAELDRRLAEGKEIRRPGGQHKLNPGTVIHRDWKGVRHQVTVTGDGFLYRNEQYATLSEVARTITGTRWSGPRFFGLETMKGGAREPGSR